MKIRVFFCVPNFYKVKKVDRPDARKMIGFLRLSVYPAAWWYSKGINPTQPEISMEIADAEDYVFRRGRYGIELQYIEDAIIYRDPSGKMTA